MTQARAALIDKLWDGRDPFASGEVAAQEVDHQGWNSEHPFLDIAIRETRPRVVVEVGVWKGGSLLTLASRLRAEGIEGVVIAIDTWLGSAEHWTVPHLKGLFGYEGGYPRLYQTFVANVRDRGLEDFVVPLPLDSVNALLVLKHFDIRPQVVHLDAGHDYRSVTNDLAAWWPLLTPGGVLIGDDYFADRSLWPDVANAYDAFFAENSHDGFSAQKPKCMVRKPV